MSNYTKTTNFASKDALTTGNTLKVVRGTELDAEFNNIATAIATKINTGETPFDVSCYRPDLPTNAEVLLCLIAARTITFPASMTGSYAKALVAATAQTDFTVKKNGTSIGTIRFAAAATTATFVGFSATTMVAGDVLTITNQATRDTTLSGFHAILKGSR